MKLAPSLLRLASAAVVLSALSACTVIPAGPVGYRAPPVYVETYPAYRYNYPSTNIYYESRHRYNDDRREHYQRDHRRHDDNRYQEQRRGDSPLEGAAKAHRDVRRSLGLPRLPGMP